MQAKTLEDVAPGLHVVRTLLKMGRYQQACEAYPGDLSNALLLNLEANAEVLSLLRPFFSQGWATLPKAVDERGGSYLANAAALALVQSNELEESLAANGAALVGDATEPPVCGPDCIHPHALHAARYGIIAFFEIVVRSTRLGVVVVSRATRAE